MLSDFLSPFSPMLLSDRPMRSRERFHMGTGPTRLAEDVGHESGGASPPRLSPHRHLFEQRYRQTSIQHRDLLEQRCLGLIAEFPLFPSPSSSSCSSSLPLEWLL